MSAEIVREYRVARQMVDMHARLRDRYHRRALLLDLTILAGSVVFAATIFAGEQAFSDLGISPLFAQDVLRVISVVLFFASVAAFRVDWKGLESRHSEAVRRLAGLVGGYRDARTSDGIWSEAASQSLSSRYSELTTSIVPIPPRQFGRLKAQFLRAKAISYLLDSRPGYPYVVAYLLVSYRALRGAGQE